MRHLEPANRWQLVPVEAQPFNAETPLEVLAEPLTPPSLFYVRSHFDVPRINSDTWRLTVDGAVEHPLTLSSKDVQRLRSHTVTVTMECAGNGRTRMSPVPAGSPWNLGAVSTGQFSGTPLHLVLEQARLRPETIEVVAVGADQGEMAPGQVVRFARSLPLEVAQHPDTLLAWALNGTPLAAEHGFPLRLVVPRWYGVASVKWLVRISALSRPFDGYFQQERYVYMGERGTPDGTPVRLIRVRAVITQPADHAGLPFELVDVVGIAWSGSGRILRVEVSADDGHSWSEADLGPAPSAYAASPWHYRWTPPAPGVYTLMARAIDDAGNTQPYDPVWNAYGYGNNVVQRVHVTVR